MNVAVQDLTLAVVPKSKEWKFTSRDEDYYRDASRQETVNVLE